MSSTVLTLPSWKQEPLSPPTCEESIWVSSSEEAFFYSSLEQNVDLKLETELLSAGNGDSKAYVASQLLEDLENLVDLDELIKEGMYPTNQPLVIECDMQNHSTLSLLAYVEIMCNIILMIPQYLY
ncbi:hypothetical protein HHI36_019213 [Cryptolaemus montrouzieri]|uniref:Uncharacterized protein n=1 Tax=Cryptolaemus montrouzieri TaxID=559131 RepID=A0ABD2P2H0_9CUCU